MSSTNMFQGLGNDSKPSSRVLRPPGGGSSDLFGQHEEVSPVRRPPKMSSTVFAPPEKPQESPKRSNPPGGKSSGIFGEGPTDAPAGQQKPAAPCTVGSNIFAEAPSNPPMARSHPNKPKDHIGIHGTPVPEVPEPKAVVSPQKGSGSAAPEAASPKLEADPNQPRVEDHEPRLGPVPRSHNKVIQPPGGKSSVVFY